MNATAQYDALYRLIRSLPAEAASRAISYVQYLNYLEEKEDQEDLAYIDAHRNEPAIPLEIALKKLGL
ncbi:MAG: hypothetical protein LBP75_00960 [Planctomycetota bacterium]|jgi:hypothetical protein|nr:hypothetical protein [Planctomycetota bacterium]